MITYKRWVCFGRPVWQLLQLSIITDPLRKSPRGSVPWRRIYPCPVVLSIADIPRLHITDTLFSSCHALNLVGTFSRGSFHLNIWKLSIECLNDQCSTLNIQGTSAFRHYSPWFEVEAIVFDFNIFPLRSSNFLPLKSSAYRPSPGPWNPSYSWNPGKPTTRKWEPVLPVVRPASWAYFCQTPWHCPVAWSMGSKASR